MSGNVYEWCEDDYHLDYYGAPNEGSAWVENPRDGHRVLRGGSWNRSANHCRSANRAGCGLSQSYYNVGFRLVLDR